MKVKELIDELEVLDEDLEVHFVYDYGDHGHQQAAPLVRNVEEGLVRHSDYLRMDRAVEDEDPKDTDKTVVLLKSTV